VTQLIAWLLDLDEIRLETDAPLVLVWDRPVAAWLLFGGALLALVWIGLVYQRERISPGRRIMLGTVRCAMVVLVGAVLCRPSLILQRNRVERSHVAVVLDTSRSMAATDHYDDTSMAQSITAGAGLTQAQELSHHSRLSLVQAALVHSEAAPLRHLLQRNAILLCTFARSVETHGYFTSDQSLPHLVDLIGTAVADGTGTDLAGAIAQVMEQSKGRRLAAVVLASDGRSTQSTSLKDALDTARDRHIPIFPLRIGSPAIPLDLEVGPLRIEEHVFVNDILAVEVPLTVQGITKQTAVTVSLVDERSGKTVDVQEVVLEPSQPSMTVELRTKPTQPGHARYRVDVSPLAAEQTVENNRAQGDVTILDDQLRVLYVDGYPRYEYRYLKNALLREPTVEVSVLLIEADERFVQEGTDPIRRFPETPEELHRYDVVLFGDVDPRSGWLTVAQMNMLLDFVGHEGGGFGLVAGERSAPQRFLGTPLETLIPVRIDATFAGRYERTLTTGFKPRLTRQGRRSRIFRLAADRTDSERLFEALPPLFWLARTLGPKPGASVLAEHPTIRTLSGPMPLVVTGRYGAGRLFFQATDDTWRWRRHIGELLHDTYWVRVVRELMRGFRVAQDRRFVMRTDRKVYPYGTAVQTQVEIFDEQLLAQWRDAMDLVVTKIGHLSAGESEGISGSPLPETASAPSPPIVIGHCKVHRLDPASSLFEGSWVPPRPGRFVIQAVDLPPRPGQQAVSVSFRVERPDLEGRHREADHQALAQVAEATGGRVLDLDELETAFEAIEDRSVRIPDDLVEPLWDSKLVLVLFVLMISMEWVMRKAWGLLSQGMGVAVGFSRRRVIGTPSCVYWPHG